MAAAFRAGKKKADIARAWGVDWTTADALFAGAGPIGIERLLILAVKLPDVFTFFAEHGYELGEANAFAPPPPDRAARQLSKAEGDLAGALDEALSDGVIDAGERAALVPLAAKVVERSAAQLRAIEGALAKPR